VKFYFFVWSFFGAIFLASVFHLPLWPYHKHDSNLYSELNNSVTIRGIVVEEPDEREQSTNLIVLSLDGREKILVRASPNSDFQYGDEIEVRGKLELPQKIDSDNRHSFDYPEYLAKDGIIYLIGRGDVKVLSSGHGNLVKRDLFKIKHAFLANLNRSLPQPYSGFLGGLIIAGKKSLPSDILEQFKRTGTLQVVVLSGYNITIVAEGIMKFFSYLPRAGGLSAGALSIVLFSIMAGGTSTIIRAAIMALISLLSRATHRVYDARRALFLAGFLMVIQNPRILAFDPSFQLSFLATLGLMTLSPYLERKLEWLPTRLQLRATVSATLAAQFFVLPLLMFQTGVISLVSVPANALLMIAVPITMLFGFILGLSGFIHHFLSLPFAFISYFFLSYELFIVKFFSNLPLSLLKIPFPLWFLILTYVIYIFIYGVRSKRSETTRQHRLSKKASTYFFFSEGG
jgi:competence protein ComEC